MSGTRKLRVGILLDPGPVPKWVRNAIERVVRSDHSQIALVVMNGARPMRRTVFRRLWAARHTFLYGLFARFDRALSTVKEDPFETTALEDLLRDVATITVWPIQTRFSDRLSDRDVDEIRGADLDVLVRFGFRILRGAILGAARFGVWSYHHGDGVKYRGSPAGIWELIEGEPVTGAVLQILTEELDAGPVIFRTYGPTDRMRPRRGLARLYWKSSVFLERELARLHQYGPPAFHERVKANALAGPRPNRLYRAPSNSEMLRFLPRHLLAILLRKLHGLLYRERWILLFDGSEAEHMPPLDQFRRMMPPADRFWADPFIVARDDRLHVFFEEGIVGHPRAHIAYTTIDPAGRPTPSRPALERPYHLSYPFVFAHGDNELFMIPETAEKNAVELYRCTRFPDRWEFVMTLIDDVCAVDPTLIQVDDLWWLFMNVQDHPSGSSLDELSLYSSPTLLSRDWRAHPANPIVSDVRSARPAGRLFRRNGTLYRPSQNSAERYGHSIVINRVITLTPSKYEEVPVEYVKPIPGSHVLAMHTLDQWGPLTVVDALLEQSVLWGWRAGRQS